mgnify:CR=1 FL=1
MNGLLKYKNTLTSRPLNIQKENIVSIFEVLHMDNESFDELIEIKVSDLMEKVGRFKISPEGKDKVIIFDDVNSYIASQNKFKRKR